MTEAKNGSCNTQWMLCRWGVFVVALAWSACGMRSAMYVSSMDAEAARGVGTGPGGVGADARGGAGGHNSGSVGSGTGGIQVGGPISTVASSGGGATLAQGGSGGGRNGGGGGNSRIGSGGTGTGGSGGRGGNSSSGGRVGGGGAVAAVSDASAPVRDSIEATPAQVPGTPTVDPASGYTTIATGAVVMSGYVTGTAQGSGSSISVTYNDSSFCASGTVSLNTSYRSWAVVAFSVNQDQEGLSGSTSPLLLTGSDLTISYDNRAGSPLEFQVWNGKDFWCYFLPTSTGRSSMTIPFSSLNTQCWDGSGTPFSSGTAITSVQLVVTGSPLRATPFDYCFLGLTVR